MEMDLARDMDTDKIIIEKQWSNLVSLYTNMNQTSTRAALDKNFVYSYIFLKCLSLGIGTNNDDFTSLCFKYHLPTPILIFTL
jgi:hypothetical protein